MVKSSSSLPLAANHARFSELVEQTLAYARQIGASDAAAEVSESLGLSVSVRKNDIETVEQTRDRSLDLTVYAGQSRGSASTSDFSEAALRQTVEAAWHIARHTAADPAAGLPDADQLATEFPDLDLHRAWTVSTEEAAELALRAERAAREVDARITNTDGATVGTYEGQFVMGNTRGFLGGYPYSRHSLSVAPIAGRGNGMQRDYWYTSERDPAKLATPEAVGRYAAERTLSRLSARRIRTGKFPVLFEAPLALGLVGALTQAANGGALYRKASFLLDHVGQRIFPDWFAIEELPLLPHGLRSAAFDAEGVATKRSCLIRDGVLERYVLGSYSARKLGLQTTGNAGGVHNLQVKANAGGFDDLLAGMRTGLLVTELMGQGVNGVTGDYSRGAAGFWVEQGVIAYPVDGITIAGNLKAIFAGIEAVGRDVDRRSHVGVGSLLVSRMTVAGE